VSGSGRIAALRDDRAEFWALLVARATIGLYLLELVLNLTRPKRAPNEPALTILAKPPDVPGSLGRLLSTPRLVFWFLITGIIAAVLLQAVAGVRARRGADTIALTWATLAVLVGAFALIPLTVLGSYPLVTLACVPSSAFVLWLLHRVQRFGRMPVPALLAAFGWGALIAWGLGRACSGLVFGVLNAHLATPTVNPDNPLSALTALADQVRRQYRVLDLLVLHLLLVSVLAEAAGIMLLLILLRRRVVDVVTGLVVGAAVGLGYTFTESVLFIKLYGSLSGITGASSGFEYWIRQSVTLLTGQVAIGAVLGAAFGIAAGLRDRGQRVRVAAAGVLAALGGAVGVEVVAAWLSHLVRPHIRVGGALDTLVVSPGLVLLVEAPFAVVAVLLLRSGVRARAAAAREAVSVEVAAGGAITQPEWPFLADPRLRLWALVSVWRRYGRDTALALRRLQTAQLDLAAWRWQQERYAAATDPDTTRRGEQLRTRVYEAKARLGAGTGSAVTR
jgi:RsiW-degrading membrane proteinase PrsW (M82 family)